MQPVTRNKILGILQPFENKRQVLVQDQSTRDIVNGIWENHLLDKGEYDKISELFLGKSVRETAGKIWSFLKSNVPYRIESVDWQTLRSPAAIVAMPGDCKSYALFANGILDSLNRKGLLNVPIAYRFASYSEKDRKEPKHVFSVIYPEAPREIWIDPVLQGFDQHLEPMYYKDKLIKPMALVRLSGISQVASALSPEQRTQVLLRYRDRLRNEQISQMAAGKFTFNSPAYQEYNQAINLVNAQISNGGIGFIDPVTVTTVLSSIIPLFGKHPSDPSAQWAAWDRIDIREGKGAGASAADVIIHNRRDVPPINIVNYIAANGLQGILNNKTYGTVTLDMIANWLRSNGFPDEAAALKKASASATNPTGSSPSAAGGKDNTIWYVLGGGAALLLLTKSRR